MDTNNPKREVAFLKVKDKLFVSENMIKAFCRGWMAKTKEHNSGISDEDQRIIEACTEHFLKGIEDMFYNISIQYELNDMGMVSEDSPIKFKKLFDALSEEDEQKE